MIILASKSPRRKELLNKIISDFTIIPSNVDENLYPVDELSLVKALDIAKSHPDDLIISADTLVKFNNKYLGKPKDQKEAKTMLQMLSNHVHQVNTVYSLVCLNKNIQLTKTITTEVHFNHLSEEVIDKYIATGSPLDKAGAYGIQDKEFNLVNHIEGSYENVMGFPLEEIHQDLVLLGYILK